MQASGTSAEDALSGIATFLSTLRGAAYGTVRYALTDNFSLGGQVGLYAITYDDGTTSTTLIDLPFHALVRYELGFFALEAFGGYYLSTIQSSDYNFAGLEAGGKVFLGGLYASYSVVMANPVYNRIEVGYQLNRIFEF